MNERGARREAESCARCREDGCGERERMSNVVIKRRWDTEREMNGAKSRKIGQEAGSE